MPNMRPNWSQSGAQNGAKVDKHEVLEAPCFKVGFQLGPSGLQGPSRMDFGKVWAGSGSLLKVLGGSHDSFLLFSLLLAAFWIFFFCFAVFAVFACFTLFCCLLSFAERCWALLGFLLGSVGLCWTLLMGCFFILGPCLLVVRMFRTLCQIVAKFQGKV